MQSVELYNKVLVLAKAAQNLQTQASVLQHSVFERDCTINDYVSIHITRELDLDNKKKITPKTSPK